MSDELHTFSGVAILIGDPEPRPRWRMFRDRLARHNNARWRQSVPGCCPSRVRRDVRNIVANCHITGQNQLIAAADVGHVMAYEDVIALQQFDEHDGRFEGDDEFLSSARWLCGYENVFIVRPVGGVMERLIDICDPRSFRVGAPLWDRYWRDALEAR